MKKQVGWFTIPKFCTKLLVGNHRCQNSSTVRFLRIDPMVSGSNPLSAKLSINMRGLARSLLIQAQSSRGVVTSRERILILFDMQTASKCILAMNTDKYSVA